MKLRLPNKLQAAIVAALASVSFTTLSTGTIAVATGAALLAGQQAQARVLDTAITSSVIVEDEEYTAENKVYVVYGDNEDSTSFTLGDSVTAEYVLITSTDNGSTPNKGRYLIDGNAATRMKDYGTIILAEGTVDGKTYKGGQIFLRENITVTNDLILGTCGYEENNGWAGSIRMSNGDKFTGKVEFVQSTTLVVGGNATFSGTVSSGDDVTVTLMKANTLTFSNGGHTNIHKVVMQETNLTINQTEQSGDEGQLYTGTVEVKGGRTLTLTPKSTANQNDRNNAPKFTGDVILNGTSSSKAQLTYTDGSTYIDGAVDMGTGGYGRMVNSWDKQQHIKALKGANATLELARNNNSGDKGGYFNLYAAEGFTGTVKLQNSAQALRSGLIVHDAPAAVAGAVMDFSANNKALLAFVSGIGDYDGNKLLTDNNTWTNGTVAGMTGSNGSVKAATLTINTAADTAYTYGGDLGVSSLVKAGTGSQTISTAVSMTGGVDVNAGTLVLGSSLTSATLSVAKDATLKLAGTNTLTISGSLTLAEGAMLDAANIAYSESPVTLGTVGTFTGTGAIVTNVAAGYKGELSVGDSNNLLLTFVQVGEEMAWHGTQDSHNWNNSVWNENTSFVPGSIANFAAGAHAVVDITDAQSANRVNVGGQAYTFNLAEGGSLSANSLNVTGNSLEIVMNGGSLTPGDITIEQDASLTISGTGSLTIGNISGAGAFVKADTSTITLNQALSGFSGTIAVNAGTLVAAADNTLGSGVNVGSGGTLVLGVHTGMPTINGSGTVKITDGDFQYNDNASYLEGFSGKVLIANGGLVQIGKHTSKFAAASSLEIGTGGTLKGWGANFTRDIVLSGGTLAEAGSDETYSGAINVTADSIVNASSGKTITLSGVLTGTGELKNAGSGTLKLSGTSTGYEGRLFADAGTVNITTATTLGSLRVGNGTLNIKADTTVNGELRLGPENGHYSGTLVVDAEKTLSVATIVTPWGFNAFTVNGTLTVRDGGQFSITSNQSDKFVSGAGIINTPQLNIGNSYTVGKFSGGLTLNIGNGGITGGRPVEFQDVTVGVLDGSNGWSTSSAVTLAAASGKATTFNIGDGKKVTLNGAVSGSGSLVKTGAGVLEITSASGYAGTYTVNEGELLFIGNLPNTLTAGGDGVLQLMGGAAEGQDSQSTNLKKVIAPNLHLSRSAAHNSRFVYNDSTDLTEVDHLYFDGAQVWLNGKEMAYAGAVTFNATTYTEKGQDTLAGAAMRLNNDATFSGSVEVAEDTKLAWAVAGGTSVTFAGKVTGDGALNLKGWNTGTGTFRVTGDASEYAGAMTTDPGIALAVEENAKLNLAGGSNLQGSVRVDGDLSMDGDGSTIRGAVTGSGKLAKTGEGTTQVSGSMASYTGSVDVAEGTLNVLNAASLSVKDITIGAGATMGVYTDTEVAEANEGKVTMAADTTLKAGYGARLNADLEMQSGSTLTVADDDAWRFGGLTMGSSVYLNTGNLLGEGDLTRLGNLGFGDYYYLFSDVENLYINDAQVGKLDFKDWQHYNMDANQVFTNLNPQTYALVYNWDNGSNVGGVALTLLPEPTTGTLSLLALAALAARRRKH